MLREKKNDSIELFNYVRFISSLLIVIFHIQNLTGIFVPKDFSNSIFYTGDKAVAVFCILSSYLLCGKTENINNLSKLLRFYFNRLLRVYPTFILCIFVIFLYQLYTPQSIPFDTLLKDALLFNLISPIYIINPIFWTLYLEILFYLFLPLFYQILKNRTIFFVILILLIIILIEFVFSTESSNRYLSLIKFFFIGFIMYRLETKMISMRTIYAFLLFLFGILFLYIDYHQYTIFNSSNLFLNEVYTFNLFIGLLIIFLITLKVKNLTILSTNLSNVLGKISYGIYCWHFFIIAVFFDMFFDGAGGIFVRQPILISNVSLMYIPFLLIPFIIAGICNYFFLEKFFNRFRLTV